jgi:hypothetical protein
LAVFSFSSLAFLPFIFQYTPCPSLMEGNSAKSQLYNCFPPKFGLGSRSWACLNFPYSTGKYMFLLYWVGILYSPRSMESNFIAPEDYKAPYIYGSICTRHWVFYSLLPSNASILGRFGKRSTHLWLGQEV